MATQGYHFNLVVWDTAGSERFHAMTAHSVRGASAVLMVFDVAVKVQIIYPYHFYIRGGSNIILHLLQELLIPPFILFLLFLLMIMIIMTFTSCGSTLQS